MGAPSATRAAILFFVGLVLSGAAAGAQPAPPGTPGPGPAHNARPASPAALSLSGTAENGMLRLEARIEVTGVLAREARLFLELPPGARLVEGLEDEAFPSPVRGTAIVRTWRIEGCAGPAVVTLRAADGSAGTTLRASWPASPPPAVVAPKRVPVRGIRVFGIPIPSAIPVGPGSDPAHPPR